MKVKKIHLHRRNVFDLYLVQVEFSRQKRNFATQNSTLFFFYAFRVGQWSSNFTFFFTKVSINHLNLLESNTKNKKTRENNRQIDVLAKSNERMRFIANNNEGERILFEGIYLPYKILRLKLQKI